MLKNLKVSDLNSLKKRKTKEPTKLISSTNNEAIIIFHKKKVLKLKKHFGKTIFPNKLL
jgi:hypothetical protein